MRTTQATTVGIRNGNEQRQRITTVFATVDMSVADRNGGSESFAKTGWREGNETRNRHSAKAFPEPIYF